MRRRLSTLAAGLAAAAIAAGCGSQPAPSSSSGTKRSSSSPPTHPTGARTATSGASGAAGAPPARPPATSSPTLSLDQLAGQRVIYAYAGLQPPGSLLRAIRAGDAAGVIFFGDNISSLPQIRSVIGELQRASLSSPLHTRLLTLTDQEGGLVRRLPGAPALSEKDIGQAANPAAVATDAGAAAGRELGGVGINVNLAPVLDVFRQPDDFTDHFQRSYSSDPEAVSTLGSAFIAAQQRVGVAATAKHFPGLGAASQAQNTDLQPVDLDLPLATLRGTDELPYRSAITARVRLVMLSWATYPALDPHLPAGLSAQVIQHELRDRLGFSGVTITDAIDAGAVRPYGSVPERALKAAAAGDDLILCATPNSPNTPELGLVVLHALASAIQSNELNRADAQRAAAAVLALRSQL